MWRNAVVAATDAEAARIGIPAFHAMTEHRAALRTRIQREQGLSIAHAAPAAHSDPRLGLICGAPETVARQMEAVEATGVGGVILTFRLGPLSWKETAASLRLFMEEVVPRGCDRCGRLLEVQVDAPVSLDETKAGDEAACLSSGRHREQSVAIQSRTLRIPVLRS